ncbi:GNAT family N-acetyltransferase [Maribacter algicola]|uniref:GNAT family N-acetyltransferase n=1 Tax=Meishania litoralis TaxID=3434685 RepID=A0ACC7LIX8_9FLAO
MQLRLEQCSHESLSDLVKISRKTFVEAFEKDNKPEDFNNYVNRAFDRENLKKQLSNKDSYFYFVYLDWSQVGYFKLNLKQAQTDLKRPESIELERIYVLKEFQNRKIGRWILQEAIKIAQEMQKEFLWLGVWEKNERAISFYEKNGFSKFGMHPYYIGSDKQMDWLMRFDLMTPESIL